MNFRFWFIPSVLLLLVASSTHAVVITIPPALDPGDQYRLVFVTSGTRDAIPTDIEVYNNFVQSAADAVPDLASLAVTWKAMGSSASVAARENTDSIPGVDDVPIFLLDGSNFADDYGDLWDGSLDIPLNIDETGNLAGSLRVWTGSNEFGQVGDGTEIDKHSPAGVSRY